MKFTRLIFAIVLLGSIGCNPDSITAIGRGLPPYQHQYSEIRGNTMGASKGDTVEIFWQLNGGREAFWGISRREEIIYSKVVVLVAVNPKGIDMDTFKIHSPTLIYRDSTIETGDGDKIQGRSFQIKP